jgi:ribokinase
MFDELEELEEAISHKSIVVMPDFYMDRIVKFESQDQLFGALSEKTRYGGGSLREIPTFDIRGGNAANIAYCLAKMGAQITLITIADEIGSMVLERTFSRFKEKVNLRILSGNPGRTTALEFVGNNTSNKVNLMVSHVGDIENFGPERIIARQDIEALEKANAVMVVNWAANSKGTDLMEHVFGKSPKALHFVDPADIETRKEEFRDDLKKIGDMIHILSINENECNSLIRALNLDSLLPPGTFDKKDLENSSKILASKLGIKNVEIHTHKGTAWSDGSKTSFAPTIKVEPKTLTGAGDSWDAANILARLAGLEAEERLRFSNAYAALYVKSDDREPATMAELMDFLRKNDYYST